MRISYFCPDNLNEILNLLKKTNSKILAGGTDLLPRFKLIDTDCRIKLVDINKVNELRKIEMKNQTIKIGASVTLAEIIDSPLMKKHFPLLVEASHRIGSNQIRQRATLVGNICNASPAADSLPALLIKNAAIRIISKDADKAIPLSEFLLGPGKTILEKGEMVKEVMFPLEDCGKGIYYKYCRRSGFDLAITGVAIWHGEETTRIALGAVSPFPFRAKYAEKLINQNPINRQIIIEAAVSASNETNPITDLRASAEYRKELVKVLVERGLCEVLLA